MTVINPAWALATEAQTPASHRRMTQFLAAARGGVVSGLAVSEKSGTPNMSVDVAEGAIIIPGTESAGTQGTYFAENQGTANVSIAAAHATLDRIDLIVAKVEDSQYSGATDAWSLVAVTGTPAASPLFPTVPANAIVLAVVDVAALASSITDSVITDLRSGTATDGSTTLINRGYAAQLGGLIRCTSVTRPTIVTAGSQIYETDTGYQFTYDGSSWGMVGNLSTGLTWTPTITQGVAVTKTVNRAAYHRFGRRIIGECHFTCSSSGTSSSVITVTLPVAQAGAAPAHAIGSGYFTDSGTSQVFGVIPYMSSASTVSFIRTAVDGTSAVFLGSSGLTQLTSGDIGSFTFSYEADT